MCSLPVKHYAAQSHRILVMSQVGDTFMQFPDPDKTSPEEFELTIKRWFESFSETLDSFETEHRQKMSGTDGEFEIDVSVRFTAFGGATFLVICECKKHRNPIKREIVQVLNETANAQSVPKKRFWSPRQSFNRVQRHTRRNMGSR